MEIKGHSIPEKYCKYVQSYSKQLGMKEVDLYEQLAEFYLLDKKEHKRTVEDKYWEMAHTALRRELREKEGSIVSTAILYKGYLFGDSGLIDFVELMKKKAESWYNNPALKQKAIEGNLVTKDGTPLDTRERVDFEDNSNYLRPFREEDHSYSRTLYGLGGVGQDMKETKFCSIAFNSELAENLKPVQNEWLVFRATSRRSSPEYELNATKVTKLKTVEEEQDIESLLRSCGKEIYRLPELEKVYELLGDDPRNPPVLIEAIVHSIREEPHPTTHNRAILLDDEDLPMGERGTWLYMPEHVVLDFKEESKVIFLATLGKNKKDVIVLNGLGYYAPPDLRK